VNFPTQASRGRVEDYRFFRLRVKKGQGRRLAVCDRRTFNSYGMTSATFHNQTLVRISHSKHQERFGKTESGNLSLATAKVP
jgi:hypothetical protein